MTHCPFCREFITVTTFCTRCGESLVGLEDIFVRCSSGHPTKMPIGRLDGNPKFCGVCGESIQNRIKGAYKDWKENNKKQPNGFERDNFKKGEVINL